MGLWTPQGLDHIAVLEDMCFASSRWDGSIRVWDATRGTLCRVMDAHAGPVRCVVRVLDTSRILTGGQDKLKTVRMFETETGQQLLICQGHRTAITCTCLRAMRNGRIVSTAAVLTADTRSIRIWNGETGDIIQNLSRPDDGSVTALTALEDGQSVLLFNGNQDGSCGCGAIRRRGCLGLNVVPSSAAPRRASARHTPSSLCGCAQDLSLPRQVLLLWLFASSSS
jgi:WD40 repeat protein